MTATISIDVVVFPLNERPNEFFKPAPAAFSNAYPVLSKADDPDTPLPAALFAATTAIECVTCVSSVGGGAEYWMLSPGNDLVCIEISLLPP